MNFDQPPSDPIALFSTWLAEAEKAESGDANAGALATVDADGLPNVRIVLLKALDTNGLVFYTNMQSVKGVELDGQPQAACCFHWKSLKRQIRVRGSVVPADEAEADAYFATRERASQIGAWASAQSQPVADRATLDAQFHAYEEKFDGQEVPRPPHWSGHRIQPIYIEFWQYGIHRLHDRLAYRRADLQTDWHTERLNP